jgi:phage virion morphogenesis protein
MGGADMSDDLTALATWAEALLAKLSPAQRRQLLYRIAQDLRRNQAQRIKNQQAPDGTAFVPRKHRKNLRGKHGRIKRQKAEMFGKLRTTKHLKTWNDANQLAVGFTGRVARIARVHQQGLKDKVAKNGAEYQYPKRSLLGFGLADHALVRESILTHLKTTD